MTNFHFHVIIFLELVSAGVLSIICSHNKNVKTYLDFSYCILKTPYKALQIGQVFQIYIMPLEAGCRFFIF